MANPSHIQLSRRERQIMDIIYRLGEATAAEVMDNLPDPPSYSAVRALLRILEEKKHLRHRQQGPRYVYQPTVSLDKAKKSALNHVLSTFFEGSVSQAVAALLDMSEEELTDHELRRLGRLINQADREGR
ncbi:MAG: BlaI/MecI/CopY family transcriptional regulator [Rhodothermales bacterium]